jgi:hypothetical protein
MHPNTFRPKQLWQQYNPLILYLQRDQLRIPRHMKPGLEENHLADIYAYGCRAYQEIPKETEEDKK